MHKIGIVTGQFDVDPTSQDLFEAASRVARVEVVDPIRFSARFNEKRTINIGPADALDFNALVIRGLNFSGETDFQFEVFERLRDMGVLVVNSPAALQIAESKFLTSFILQEKGFRVPASRIIQQLYDFEVFLGRHKDVIAKPIYGFQGYGVTRVRVDEADARERIEELLNEYKCICLQEYIPNPGRDIRAFVVGDEVVASIYRLAQIGRWKTNVSAGAKPQACTLTEKQHEIAVEACRELGLDYSGVDIIEGPDGDCILEVNGAPSWGGIMEATGKNVAEDVINHVLHRLRRGVG